MECRVRRAMFGDQERPEGPFPIDINEACLALGNVLSECMAHVPTKSAKHLVDELLVARKKWQKHPRVMAQQEPAGNA